MTRSSPRVLATLILLAMALPLASPAQPNDPGNGKHLFILSGQSNMRNPLPASFERAVGKVLGSERIIVVTHARPSQPIRRWYRDWTPPQGTETDDKENGQLYQRLMQQVHGAVGDQALATVTLIWMQGEADAGKGWGSVYERSFLGLLDQFREDLGRDRIHFVIGRINDHWLASKGIEDGELVRGVQRKLGEDHATGAWIDTDDLNRGVNPWGLFEADGGHFPPAGYRVLGQRFAFEACRLIDPERKPDPSVFDAAFMDTPDDIDTHEAIGKPVTGPTAAPGDHVATAIAALTDGKFGGADPTAGHWVGYPPETDRAEWVIDLGSEQEISSVAASILINPEVSAGFPLTLDFAVSSDGREYLSIVRRKRGTGVGFGYRDKHRLDWNKSLGTQSILVLVENSADARYLKVTARTAESWLFIDEIAVNPVPESPAAID